MGREILLLGFAVAGGLLCCDTEPDIHPARRCNTTGECLFQEICVDESTGATLDSVALPLTDGCACDYFAGVCEAATKCSYTVCTCDPDCGHAVTACASDFHCDHWCSKGADPDCIGTASDGKYCGQPATGGSGGEVTDIDSGASGGEGGSTGGGGGGSQAVTYDGVCVLQASSGGSTGGGSGGWLGGGSGSSTGGGSGSSTGGGSGSSTGGGSCDDPGVKYKASCDGNDDCGSVLHCMRPCPSCDKSCNLPCGGDAGGDELCASYGAGKCGAKLCTNCYPTCKSAPTRCEPL